MSTETKPETQATPTEAPKAEGPKVLAETAKLPEVIAAVNGLIEALAAKRDRGPNSTREMTDEDAKRVILGDMSELTHGKAAEALGLSYGQVYSARGGYTFKAIYKEWHDKHRDRTMAGPKK